LGGEARGEVEDPTEEPQEVDDDLAIVALAIKMMSVAIVNFSLQ
jgi:hypothetical protein